MRQNLFKRPFNLSVTASVIKTFLRCNNCSNHHIVQHYTAFQSYRTFFTITSWSGATQIGQKRLGFLRLYFCYGHVDITLFLKLVAVPKVSAFLVMRFFAIICLKPWRKCTVWKYRSLCTFFRFVFVVNQCKLVAYNVIRFFVRKCCN